MVRLQQYFVPVFMAVLLLAGCGNNPVTAPDMQQNTPTGQRDPLARIFFTGRDSFGMAFKAKVSNARLDPSGSGFDIASTGHATHLGPIDVEQDLSVDEAGDTVRGAFTFTGQHGQMVLGKYKAARNERGHTDQYDLDGTFWITNHNIKATKAETDTGWGDLTGTLDLGAKTMSYRMDGWLLHFVRGD